MVMTMMVISFMMMSRSSFDIFDAIIMTMMMDGADADDDERMVLTLMMMVGWMELVSYEDWNWHWAWILF